jgi:chemotaxis protein CheD
MLTNERSEPENRFMVGMADLMVSQDQSLTLCTFPLGACLGIAIYDPVVKVGGILHSMLPDSSIGPKRAAARPGMFLDTGLARLLGLAEALKAKKENLLVYVAGASEILDETTFFNLGKRNYAVLAGLLARHGVKIHAEDVGGRANRTMQLNLATGEARVKIPGQARTKLLCKS